MHNSFQAASNAVPIASAASGSSGCRGWLGTILFMAHVTSELYSLPEIFPYGSSSSQASRFHQEWSRPQCGQRVRASTSGSPTKIEGSVSMPVGIGPPVIGHLIITALMAPTRSLPRAQDTIGSFGQARKISVRNGTNDSADQSPVFRLRQ